MIVLGTVSQVEVVNITLNDVEFKNVPLMNTMGVLKQYGTDERNYMICTDAKGHNQNNNDVFSSLFGNLFDGGKCSVPNGCSFVVVVYTLGRYSVQARNTKTQKQVLEEHISCMETEKHWQYDEYMLGITNGIKFAKACLSGTGTPCYKSKPPTWASDKINGSSIHEPEMSATRNGGHVGLPTR